MTIDQQPHFTDEDAALTREIGILDCHSDFPLGVLTNRFNGNYTSLRDYWLPQLRAGGVSTVVSAIYLPDSVLPESALRVAVQMIDALFLEIEANADQIELALSGSDIERITGEGRVAALMSFEGAEALGSDLSALRLFHRLGMRMLSFTWMRRTAFADGSWENESRGGLTRLGRRAVTEMNRLGIVVDVSHASDQTTWDVLEESDAPVIASHSNARALHVHPRNVTDDMVKAIAASGGVVGAVAVSGFISNEQPTIAKWVDHIDHLVSVAGIDHVGIGADFYHHIGKLGGFPRIAENALESHGAMVGEFTGMLDSEDLPGLTAELRRRGYSREDMAKIYHGNFVRVIKQVTG
jgi:membrane dipeptidase